MNICDLIYQIGSLHLKLPQDAHNMSIKEFKKALLSILKNKTIISMDELAHLPKEIILKIAYTLPPKIILKYCKDSKKIAKICSIGNFWSKKYKYDFDDYYNIKLETFDNIYSFRAKQNQKLRSFLIVYSNYEHFNLKFQKKIYNEYMIEFKDMKKYIYKNMFKDLSNDLIESHKMEIRSKFINFEIFFINRHILFKIYKNNDFNDVILDLYMDESLLTRMLNIFNSITGSNYTFKLTLKLS